MTLILKNVHTNNERNTNWEWKNVLNKKACFTLSDINHSRILYDPPPRILEIKNKQMGPNETLHNKGSYK